jgi:CRISPR/Cas system-associated exonuclease Cas4 (RecB family)
VAYSVSFSALECYEQCSEKYRLRYIERLSSEKIPSPLFFGTAIDSALELLLLQKKELLTDKELDLQLNETAHSIFDKTMREQDGKLLERNPLCDYFLSDFDPAILKIEDLKLLEKSYPAITDFFEFFESCRAVLKQRRELKTGSRIVFNHMCWLSLYRKGELLLEAYARDILPQIHQVYSIQKDISLTNGSGDTLRGKIDYIASFKETPEYKRIMDNKTSSEAYGADAVTNSVQLAIYCEAEGIDGAGYSVLEKKIRVKEPKARTQLILGTISDEQKQKTFDIVEEKLNNIASEKYEKKASPKECFSFGKKCEFYNLCWNGDTSGIKKRPERV